MGLLGQSPCGYESGGASAVAWWKREDGRVCHTLALPPDAPNGPLIHVLGADLMDGTPIYDIKPYVVYADSHPDARSGFVDNHAIRRLEVEMSDDVVSAFTKEELESLRGVLELDPRPQYQDIPEKVYGMLFAGKDVKFRVSDGVVRVVGVE